jgi:SpoVK/Ycf46/Vps4 family AAA+-type ATPase
LSPAEVYASSYVGEAEAVVRRAFALARSAAPCVLFFDEIDSIFGGTQNEGRGNSAEARVLSTFLNEMDGLDNNKGADGVLVLAATNRPWTLDSALLRPGRLGDKIIYIPPPDETARRAILEMQFAKQLAGHCVDIESLASDSVTGLMTGAELVGACQEAKLRLLSNWSQQDLVQDDVSHLQEYFLEVLKSKKPLLSNPVALNEFRLFEQMARGQ